MTTSFYLGPTASDIVGSTSGFQLRLDDAPAGASTITQAQSATSGTTEQVWGVTPAGVPGADGGSGAQSWTVKLNLLTGADAASTLRVAVRRIGSTGTVLATSAFTATQSATAGVKTFTLTGVDLGTWATGDRLVVIYEFGSPGGHGNTQWDVEVGTVNDEVITPFAAPAQAETFQVASVVPVARDLTGPAVEAFQVASAVLAAQDALAAEDDGTHSAVIPHTYVEGGHRLGPFRDANGSLYIFLEVSEATGQPFMLKSSDGGDTWAEVDQAGRPAQTDMEGTDVRLVDHVLHIGVQGPGSDDVRYFTFNTSSHPTAPDEWVLNELVASAVDPIDQTTCLEVRGDGTVVIGYGRAGPTTDHVAYKIRSTGGAWGSETIINSGDTTNTYTQIASVMDANGLIHFLYKSTGGSGSVLTRTLSTGDVLEGAERTVATSVGTASDDRQPILPPRTYVDGSDQVVLVAYKSSGSTDVISLRTITNAGTPSAANQISHVAVARNVLGMNSRQPVATFIRDPETGELHLFYVNAGADGGAADSTRTLYHRQTDGGVWQTEEVFINGGIDSHAMRAEAFTHAPGNGGKRVIGLYWDTGSAGLEGAAYDEYVLPAAGGAETFQAVTAVLVALDATATAAPTVGTFQAVTATLVALDAAVSAAGAAETFQAVTTTTAALDAAATADPVAGAFEVASVAASALDAQVTAAGAAGTFAAATTTAAVVDATFTIEPVAATFGAATAGADPADLALATQATIAVYWVAWEIPQADVVEPQAATFQVVTATLAPQDLTAEATNAETFTAASAALEALDLLAEGVIAETFAAASVALAAQDAVITVEPYAATASAATAALTTQDLTAEGVTAETFAAATVNLAAQDATAAPGVAAGTFDVAQIASTALDLSGAVGGLAETLDAVAAISAPLDLVSEAGGNAGTFDPVAVALTARDAAVTPGVAVGTFTAASAVLALGELAFFGEGQAEFEAVSTTVTALDLARTLGAVAGTFQAASVGLAAQDGALALGVITETFTPAVAALAPQELAAELAGTFAIETVSVTLTPQAVTAVGGAVQGAFTAATADLTPRDLLLSALIAGTFAAVTTTAAARDATVAPELYVVVLTAVAVALVARDASAAPGEVTGTFTPASALLLARDAAIFHGLLGEARGGLLGLDLDAGALNLTLGGSDSGLTVGQDDHSAFDLE